MSEDINLDLSGVPETLLIPLYGRGMESQRPDAILKDDKALAIVSRLNYDFSQVKKIRMFERSKVARMMLTRQIDRFTRDFLIRHPEGIVVHIGCGFDTRFERVDNGRVEWYDLDMPAVIELRRKIIGGEADRYHLLGCSVLENAWLETVKAHARRPYLFVADNVFIYFTEAQVKALVLKLRDNFPGAELVFDGWTPFFIWMANIQLSSSKFTGLLKWGFTSGKTLEGWGEGIRIIDQWGFFDQPEPRMAAYRWAAPLFRWLKPISVFHFQLGAGV